MAKRRHYYPINPKKYNGKIPLILKSSWEENFARNYCDLNEACLEWSYEPVKIPYADPTKVGPRKQTIYIPDFLIVFNSYAGLKTALIEIKPLHETLQEHARNYKDAVSIARNAAKWRAAKAWCERRNGVDFIILTEAELFAGGENIKPRKRQVQAYGQYRMRK